MCSGSRMNDFHTGFRLALGDFLRCSASAVTRWSRSSWSRYPRWRGGCSISSVFVRTRVVGSGADFERTSGIFCGRGDARKQLRRGIGCCGRGHCIRVWGVPFEERVKVCPLLLASCLHHGLRRRIRGVLPLKVRLGVSGGRFFTCGVG